MRILSVPSNSMGGGDPFFSNVRVLAHFDTYPYVDSSSFNTPMSALGAGDSHDTTTPLVGSGSLKTTTFRGAHVNTFNYNLDPAVGFCVEMVFNIASFPSSAPCQLLGCWTITPDDNFFRCIVTPSGYIEILNRVGGVNQGAGTATTPIAVGNTYHVAYSCAPGGLVTIYVNGVDQTGWQVPMTNPIIEMSQGFYEFTIGYASNRLNSPFWYSDMRFDELRITVGNKRYNGNFIPQYPFPNE